MGLALIILAIVGMNMNDGGHQSSFVSLSAGLPLVFLLVVAALVDIVAAFIGFYFTLCSHRTDAMVVGLSARCTCSPLALLGCLDAIAGVLNLWSFCALLGGFAEVYTELWSAHSMHGSKGVFVASALFILGDLFCKFVAGLRLCQYRRSLRTARYAARHSEGVREAEMETLGLVNEREEPRGPDWGQSDEEEHWPGDDRKPIQPNPPGDQTPGPILTPELFEVYWMDMPDTGTFKCSLGSIPHLEVVRRHLEAQGFRVIASGSLEPEADGSQMHRMFFFKQDQPHDQKETDLFLARFEFTQAKTRHMEMDAVFKCSVPERTSLFVQSLRLRHVIDVLD